MLWKKANLVAEAALAKKALHPIATNKAVFAEEGVELQINVVNTNILKKISTSKTQGNPFLPYEQDMYVQDFGAEHVVLLNKFPVLSPHILVCSKSYVEQTSPLALSDFAAWLDCFQSEDSLGFYNGGKQAGASQPHRHMQLVKAKAPLEVLIKNGRLPFTHKLCLFDSFQADIVYEKYLEGMKELGLLNTPDCRPHNLLMTKEFLCVIPRSQARYHDVFLNGLNYAGFFLLKSEEQLGWLKDFGCLNLLKYCVDQ